MARIIRIEATAPIKIEPKDFPRDAEGNFKPMFICACGLTNKPPFCDGTHKACKVSEEPGFVYTYDSATKQIVDKRPEGA